MEGSEDADGSMRKTAKNSNKMTMAIGGRRARPCDVCGEQLARWYCGADQANLCDSCDGSVHTANSVACRHERVRLTPTQVRSAGAPLTNHSSALLTATRSSIWRHASRKRSRPSSRPHPDYQRQTDEIITKLGRLKPSIKVFDFMSTTAESNGDDDYPLHQVPILADEFDFMNRPTAYSTLPSSTAPNENSSAGPMGGTGRASCEELPVEFLESKAVDLCDFEVEMSLGCSFIGPDAHVTVDDLGGLGLYSFSKPYADLDAHDGVGFFDSQRHNCGCSETDHCEGSSPMDEKNGEIPLSWLCNRVKVEESEDVDHVFGSSDIKVEEQEDIDLCDITVNEDVEVKIKLDFDDYFQEEEKKICLRLDYEDVLIAWSDRGSLWADNKTIQAFVDDTSSDGTEGFQEYGIVPDLSLGIARGASGDQGEQVPVMNGGGDHEGRHGEGREARVMRYREKRRSRLFSKKIRYEVRKLNAEKRPRMKGRFVKRTPGLSLE
uniref:CONSTANS-like protein 6 n=1 Tax=Ginkgo biloba TaxID=3311 RepID=A0A2U8RMJ9_GINBI|eukprot:Gb_00164 [translate_table: standard]